MGIEARCMDCGYSVIDPDNQEHGWDILSVFGLNVDMSLPVIR